MRFKKLLLTLPFIMCTPIFTMSCKETTIIIKEDAQRGYISSTLFLEIRELLNNAHNPPNPNNPFEKEEITQEQKEANLKALTNKLNEEYFKGDLIKIVDKDLFFNREVEIENLGFANFNEGWKEVFKQGCFLMYDKKAIRFNF